MTRIVALGDAHLGKGAFHKLTPEGMNQREQDFLDAFERAVDLTIAQEPDLFCWVGDIFDHPRPSYRTYRAVNRALFRLEAAGVPGVVISGNHDTPRLRTSGSPYASLADTHGGVHFACSLAGESFPLSDGVVVHAVPHTIGVEELKAGLDAAATRIRADATNILLTHAALTSLAKRHYRDVNELEIGGGDLHTERFDLVLLGHYHVHQQVDEHAWYTGSTDAFSFGDVDAERGDDKYVLLVDTDAASVKPLPIAGRRRLLTLRSVEAKGKGPAEVGDALAKLAGRGDRAGAVARLYIENLDPTVDREIDWVAARAMFEDAGVLAVSLHRSKAGAVGDLAGGPTEQRPLADEWAGYVATAELDAGFERGRVVSTGADYLARAVAR